MNTTHFNIIMEALNDITNKLKDVCWKSKRNGKIIFDLVCEIEMFNNNLNNDNFLLIRTESYLKGLVCRLNKIKDVNYDTYYHVQVTTKEALNKLKKITE